MNYFQKIVCLLLVVLTGSIFTACIEEGENKGFASNYATVVGDKQTGYHFYLDDGVMFYPTNLSPLADFKNSKRAYITFTYNTDDYDQVNQTLKGELYGDKNYSVPVRDILTKEEADARMLTDKDSVWAIDASNIFLPTVGQGYLNLNCVSRCDGTNVPELNAYYLMDEVLADTLTVHVLLNSRIKSGIQNSVITPTCFRLQPFADFYNRDSLCIKVLFNEKPIIGKIHSRMLNEASHLY